MRRLVKPELLDSDAGTPAEVAASLADLRLVNRWFGGIRTTLQLVDRVVDSSPELSLLDVASASGDVPGSVAEHLARRGIRTSITLLERARSHMRANGRYVAGDALALPFADASFDLVTCSLFVHHLEPHEIIAFVNEGLRVTRRAVLINDLRRHPIHLALIYAGWPLFRSRLTRHDSVASVWRSYTPQELAELLARTRAARVEISRYYLFRIGAIAWRN
ncbi:MAG TPA: methyltransferase domain-containing protein [Terriglobales bacterium]|nr:methyltransferase domain-containing protein [Terriglobales bacterium]